MHQSIYIFQIASLEEFGIDICQVVLDSYNQAQNCEVYIKQEPWRELPQSGQSEDTSYIHGTKYTRYIEVIFQDREGEYEMFSLQTKELRHFKLLLHKVVLAVIVPSLHVGTMYGERVLLIEFVADFLRFSLLV